MDRKPGLFPLRQGLRLMMLAGICFAVSPSSAANMNLRVGGQCLALVDLDQNLFAVTSCTHANVAHLLYTSGYFRLVASDGSICLHPVDHRLASASCLDIAEDWEASKDQSGPNTYVVAPLNSEAGGCLAWQDMPNGVILVLGPCDGPRTIWNFGY